MPLRGFVNHQEVPPLAGEGDWALALAVLKLGVLVLSVGYLSFMTQVAFTWRSSKQGGLFAPLRKAAERIMQRLPFLRRIRSLIVAPCDDGELLFGGVRCLDLVVSDEEGDDFLPAKHNDNQEKSHLFNSPLAPLPHQSSEQAKDMLKTRRPIGVQSITGADGVKRAVFYSRSQNSSPVKGSSSSSSGSVEIEMDALIAAAAAKNSQQKTPERTTKKKAQKASGSKEAALGSGKSQVKSKEMLEVDTALDVDNSCSVDEVEDDHKALLGNTKTSAEKNEAMKNNTTTPKESVQLYTPPSRTRCTMEKYASLKYSSFASGRSPSSSVLLAALSSQTEEVSPPTFEQSPKTEKMLPGSVEFLDKNGSARNFSTRPGSTTVGRGTASGSNSAGAGGMSPSRSRRTRISPIDFDHAQPFSNGLEKSGKNNSLGFFV
ncbi:unnamed protein product [Amoebophrya sp. A120]|nr:unnamed protein product [Amoebophrya sp. A120]|eukprot:GSA120T00011292001.1